MSVACIDNSRIRLLAARLERDIHLRGLTAGDHYITGVEAGHLLGVSRATAQRAMAFLARQDKVVRRRRRGTFVGPSIETHRANKIRTVHVLMLEYAASPLFSSDLLIQGIRSEISDANVQFSFLPPAGRLRYVKDLLQEPMSSGQLCGVLAVSCGREGVPVPG